MCKILILFTYIRSLAYTYTFVNYNYGKKLQDIYHTPQPLQTLVAYKLLLAIYSV